MRRQKPAGETGQKYQADVALAARLADFLDAARKAEGSFRQAEALRAPGADIRRLAEDLDAALTAAMLAAYAAQRAEIGPRGYDDRIYRRKAMAKPGVHALTAKAEHLLTLREAHRLNGIPAVAFKPGPLASSAVREAQMPGNPRSSRDQQAQGKSAATDEALAARVGAPAGKSLGGPPGKEHGEVAVANPDQEMGPVNQHPDRERSARFVLPDDIGSLVDQISRYTRRRGLLVAAILHPFFKALLLLYNYDETKKADVSIPLVLGALRWAFPLRLRLSFSGNEASLSIHFFWQWVERLFGRLASGRESGRLYPKALTFLLSFYTGQGVARKDLKASKGQILILIAAFSLLPYLLSLLSSPNRVMWSVLRSLGATMRTALRPVPALLAVLVIMFSTGDAWRMFGVEAGPRFIIFIGTILTLSLVSLLLAMRNPHVSWKALTGYSEGGPNVLRTWAERTPAKKLITLGVMPVLPLASGTAGEAADSTDDPRLRRNIIVIYALTMIVHVIAIVFWISLAFMMAGTIIVNPAMTKNLSAVPARIVFEFNLFGQEFALTRQLVLLSVTLGCIAALTFATSALQSTEGRKVFADYALMDLRRSLGALSYYLGSLRELLLERKYSEVP
ncbi:MAG TPA: hypothetical protein VN969_31885 [Streptosporangiaceae bacterium]|nr:hypothetical protein [Streptosporangiaceae bacterium]